VAAGLAGKIDVTGDNLKSAKPMFNISKIKNYLAENPDIVAAYLFGSAVSGEQIVNDLDILVLLDQKVNMLNIQ